VFDYHHIIIYVALPTMVYDDATVTVRRALQAPSMSI
jgi:hypothetical protein